MDKNQKIDSNNKIERDQLRLQIEKLHDDSFLEIHATYESIKNFIDFDEKRIIEFIKEIEDDWIEKPKIYNLFKNPEKQKKLIDNLPNKIGKRSLGSLIKMCNVYLISLLEQYIKETFRILYRFNPNMLKTKDKSLNIETILNFENYDVLVENIIDEELEFFGRRNIDQIAKKIKYKTNIDCKKDFMTWRLLREQYYRRNLIVHNFNKIGEKYCMIMNLEKKWIGDEFPISKKYLEGLFRNVISFYSFLQDQINIKFCRLHPV
jgi:hypothetical protein